MDKILLILFMVNLIQCYMIIKLYKKTKWWEEVYHNTKRAHSHIVNNYLTPLKEKTNG